MSNASVDAPIWLRRSALIGYLLQKVSILHTAAFVFSLPVGGIFLFTQFRDVDDLSDYTINVIYIAFTCMAGAGVVILALLRRPPAPTPVLSPSTSGHGQSIDDPTVVTVESPRGPVQGAVVAGTPATNTKEEEGGELMKPDPKRDEEREGFVNSFGKSNFRAMRILGLIKLPCCFQFKRSNC